MAAVIDVPGAAQPLAVVNGLPGQRLFTAKEYQHLVEVGILNEDERIELICLLNLQNRELEDYREPGSNGYRRKQTYSEDESFNLVAFPKISIKVKDLLPPVKGAVKRRKK
jgi:hypothetical protein